jgi:hypothetical protein
MALMEILMLLLMAWLTYLPLHSLRILICWLIWEILMGGGSSRIMSLAQGDHLYD